jgi:hypothetical protein
MKIAMLWRNHVLLSDSETGELRATVIDFGLSRAKSAVTGELFWTRIPEDVHQICHWVKPIPIVSIGFNVGFHSPVDIPLLALPVKDILWFHPVTNLMVSFSHLS